MSDTNELSTALYEIAEREEFECTGVVPAAKLTVNPEVRGMCGVDRCKSFGKNWMCPPHCGDLDHFQSLIDERKTCFVVQTVKELEDEFDFEGMIDAEHAHKLRFRSFAREVKSTPGLESALLLAAGTCTLCPRCGCPDEPCRHPEQALVSMEAAGLLVSEVCISAQIPYNHGKGTIAYTSCVVY